MTARMNSEYRQVLPSGRALGSVTLVSGAARESPDMADCACDWNWASADVGADVAGGAKSSATAARGADARKAAMDAIATVLSCG